MIYTVTTNQCIDYYMDLTAPLRVGEINRAGREECRPGGKGVNVAILLARLGAEACALGFCAGASGGMLRTLLAAAGCRNDLTELTGGMTRINVKILGAPETAFNGSGPAVDEAALERARQAVPALAISEEEHCVRLAVPAEEKAAAVREIHARLMAKG